MKEPRNCPDSMMLDAEQEFEDEAQADGWHFPPVLPPSPAMIEAFSRRGNERAAAALASDRYYTLTARGRLAAERVDAAERAQLERTKETT